MIIITISENARLLIIEHKHKPVEGVDLPSESESL